MGKFARVKSIVLTACIVLGFGVWTASMAAAAAEASEHSKRSPYGKLAPVSLKQVQIDDEFWNPRQKRVAR